VISEPDQALPCGFPFEGPTIVQGVSVRLPGATPDSVPRWLILQLERCSAPFPFDQVIVDRDNDSAPGRNAEDENLMPAWAKAEESGNRPASSLMRPFGPAIPCPLGLLRAGPRTMIFHLNLRPN
jgi:hypothetical protein